MQRFDYVLIGGGHANCAVLADWARRGKPHGVRAALITPQPYLAYSGMVPGWIVGNYPSAVGQVDLARLAARAGAELVLDRCCGIGAQGRSVVLSSGEEVGFTGAAIDTGGVGQGAQILGNDPRLLDVRPMDQFISRLAAWRQAHQAGGKQIVVTGGGAGGVELAFALRNMAGIAAACNVTLVTGRSGLLPGFAQRLQHLAAAELSRQNITVLIEDARLAAGALHAGKARIEPAHLIVTALGSAAPDWPHASGLACDEAGFIAVDKHQRSLSHPHILAAGDVASRSDREVPRSGVHAVHAGPVLAANLRALVLGEQPAAIYRPRPASLYLMSTGTGSALASYGPLAGQGAWAQRLKRWIDTRWIGAYAKL